jgi:hypothetical protein
MTCPYCHHVFPLTWGRYFRSPLGTHACPACGTTSRLNWPLRYFAFVVLAWLVFVSFAFLLAGRLFSPEKREAMGVYYFILIYVIGCALIMPLDRWYDERFRKLEKLPKKPWPTP